MNFLEPFRCHKMKMLQLHPSGTLEMCLENECREGQIREDLKPSSSATKHDCFSKITKNSPGVEMEMGEKRPSPFQAIIVECFNDYRRGAELAIF